MRARRALPLFLIAATAVSSAVGGETAPTPLPPSRLPPEEVLVVPDPGTPDSPANLQPIRGAGSVTVEVGSGVLVDLPAPVERFAIGDDGVAAVHVVSSREVLLQGERIGHTSVFVWLQDGRRISYQLVVSPHLGLMRSALAEIDSRIRVEPGRDGGALVLRGDVADARVAERALSVAEQLASGDGGSAKVVSLLHFPGFDPVEVRLQEAMAAVDARIVVRRIQVGEAADSKADAIVLEGQVRDVSSLVRAMTLAELQLGGQAGPIVPTDPDVARTGRFRGFVGSTSGGSQALQGNDPPAPGIATHVARGQVMRTASGRVISFLAVDALPQIVTSIRVLEVDRGRARQLGVDFRLDTSHFSLGSIQRPGASTLSRPGPSPSVTGLVGGAVAAFVDRTMAIAAAIDLLEQKDAARSLAEPNLTTLSGEQASVLVGGEVPIPTAAVGNVATVQGVFFQDFGVRLDIRPTLGPGGVVALELSPSIVRPSGALGVNGVPGFQVQTVQTTARVAPGQSLVVAGLLSFEESTERRGVPGLAEVPGLRNIFGWHRHAGRERELLFVITPRLLAEPTVDMALRWRTVEPLTGTPELPPLGMPSADWQRGLEPGELDVHGLPPQFVPVEPVPRPAEEPASEALPAAAPTSR